MWSKACEGGAGLRKGRGLERVAAAVGLIVVVVCVLSTLHLHSSTRAWVLGGAEGGTSRRTQIVVYNKPRKTGSCSIAELLAAQLGGSEEYHVPPAFHNDYLTGLNVMSGATLFVQHRAVTEDMVSRLRHLGPVIRVTSTRDPMTRWPSEYKQLKRLNSSENIDWEDFERWMTGKNCAFHLTYHSGEAYDCRAMKQGDMVRAARRIVKMYDVVLDLDHLKESSVVAAKILGVDLMKIGIKNVRRNRQTQQMPSHIEEKLRESTKLESVLHTEMLLHLALNYQAIVGKRCVKDPNDTSACWSSW